MSPRLIRLAKSNASLLALVVLGGCASLRSTSSNRLDQQITQADAACRTLGADHVTAYNKGVAGIARAIDGKTPAEVRTELEPFQVKIDEPKIQPSSAFSLRKSARSSTLELCGVSPTTTALPPGARLSHAWAMVSGLPTTSKL